METKILRQASYKAETASRKNLAIVDSKVENYQEFIRGVQSGTEVILLDRTRDGIKQITEILAQRSSITSLHIVSHGRQAAVEIGSTELNIDNLETYSSQLHKWGKALNESGSILLYGCNVAAGESGIQFIHKLSELTGANIAASNNLTGSAALGGDWELEITTGQINTEIAFEKAVLEGYTSVLATLAAEEFKNTTAIGPWIYGVGNTLTPSPGLTAGAANPNGVIPALGTGDTPGTGTLRLTSNQLNQAAFVIYNNPISATEGLRVTFDFFAYNRGTVPPPGGPFLGADGISFFLIDGTATPTAAGGFGGSLGYAQNTNPNPALFSTGLSGGYLGVGLDEFGNFSNSVAKTDGPGPQPDSVAIRGSESTNPTENYKFLGSSLLTNTLTGVSIGIDNIAATNRNDLNTKRSVQITLFPTTSATPNRLTVAFDLDGSGTFDAGETLLDIPNLAAINGAVPRTFKFGFAASTGGNSNIHEVNNVIVQSIDPPTLVADVSIVKKGPLFAIPNSTITYTITSTNNGPNTAESVLIQDPLPEGLSFVGASDLATYNPTTRTVIWPAIPTLANGASEVRTITAVVPATGGAALTNTAYSTSSTFDPNLANNNSSQPISQVSTTIVDALADVVTTKIGTVTETVGRTVSYTISTVNNGPSTAENVIITDSIVPGLTIVSLSNGTYDPISGIVTFSPVASLASGAPAAITNTVSFIAPPDASVSNTARNISATPDPFPENNNGTDPLAKVTTTLTPSADVVTTKIGPVTETVGRTVTYTISTVNNGPSTAENITITDTIIPDLTGVIPSNGGVYDPVTGIVSFAPVASLASGVTVTNTVRFIAPASGSVTNTARSTSPTADPTPGNNEATFTTTLTPTPTPNQPPVANNSNSSLGPNSSRLVTGLGGSDPDPDGSIASYTINTLPPADQAVLFLGDPTNGGVPVTAGQVLTPEQLQQLFFFTTGNFTGANFTYSATDNSGAISPPATATVAGLIAPTPTPTPTPTTPTPTPTPTTPTPTPTPTTPTPTPSPTDNQPPLANNANSSLGPNSSQLVTGLGGSDPDGSIASYTINTLPPADQAVLFLGDPANGGVPVTAGQVLTPEQLQQLFLQATGNFTGANFTYSATDNSGASSPAVATVAAILPTDNQPPLANNANSSLGPNSSRLVTGLGGSDPDGSIASYTINTLPRADQAVLFLGDPANGGVAVTPGQVLTPQQLQQLYFQTTGSFTGANFTYSATDNSGATSPPATATVTPGLIAPTPTPTPTPTDNQPPLANNANSSLGPNSSRLVTGLGGSDDGSIASYTINTLPPAAQGVLFLGDPANGGVPVTPGQVLTPEQLGQLFFQSTGDFTGANFTYSATDNNGATSPLATATLGSTASTPTPNPLNLPPVTNNANFTVDPNSSARVPGLGGSDPDGSIASYTINTLPPAGQGILFLGDPANGGVAVTAGQVLTPEQIEQLFFQSTGSFTGANFSYSATDNSGATSPATATVAAISPTSNQPPSINNVNFTVPTNGIVQVLGLGGSDPDGSIVSYTITSVPPANQGVLFLSDSVNGDVPVTAGQVLTPAQLGQLFFVATVDFNGATFSYTATDNLGKVSPASATVAAILRPVGTVPPLTPTPTPTPAPGISNPIGEPDTDCLCQPIPEKPGINFAPPQQPPAVGFFRPISQLGEGQTTKGTDGDDFIVDTKGNQKIVGFEGNDLLLGEDGADEIHGDEGNDAIFAGTDTDIAYGGDGNDIVHAGKQNDWIAGDLGSDSLFGDLGADTILGDNGNDNDRSAQNNGDLIFGGNGADLINGNEGDDTIHTGKGDDIALGGKENDLMWGELGSDTLFGGIGSDSLFGGISDQRVSDSQGRDLLYGGFGNDFLNGQQDNDTLVAGKDDDRAYGGKGNDLIYGQLGSDTLYGGQGADTLLGDSGSSQSIGDIGEQDLIFGDSGNDIIGGGHGNDTVQAGKGNDCVWGGKDNDLIWGELGSDTLVGDSGDDTMYGSTRSRAKDVNGQDWLFGGDGADALFGDEGDDTISGGQDNDLIYGGKNNDLVHGDAGNDLIYGGDGSDELCGGEGNDTIYGDRADNRGFSVGANEQQDCINGGDGDDLLYGNEGQDTINGDAGSDTLFGGKDSDILNGGAGDDWLFGDAGDDTLIGGIGSDRFVLNGEGGTDTVINFEVGVDKFVLTGGVSFQQLQFSATPNGTLLQVAGTDRVLANLVGINGAIGSSDFLPNLSEL